jgi:serine/threonine-protein kinase
MHLTEEVPAPRSANPKIPKSLNDIVRKATRKNLKNRYRSAQEMRRDLMRARREPGGGFVRLKEEPSPAGREVEWAQSDRAKRRINAIVGLVAVLVLGTIALFVFGNVSAVEGLWVASVVGMEQSKAESKLEKLGFVTDVVVEPDSEEPAGTVFKQEPAAGEKLVEGGIVRIYISVGVSTGTMPDVLDMKLSNAIDVLKKNNLAVGDVTQVPSDEPSEYVVRQDPKPGDELLPNTQVDLWVSGGSEELPGGTAAVTEAP